MRSFGNNFEAEVGAGKGMVKSVVDMGSGVLSLSELRSSGDQSVNSKNRVGESNVRTNHSSPPTVNPEPMEELSVERCPL